MQLKKLDLPKYHTCREKRFLAEGFNAHYVATGFKAKRILRYTGQFTPEKNLTSVVFVIRGFG